MTEAISFASIAKQRRFWFIAQSLNPLFIEVVWGERSLLSPSDFKRGSEKEKLLIDEKRP